MSQQAPEDRHKFEDLAGEPPPSFIRDVWDLVSSDRRWLLAPIMIAIVLLGALVMLTGTGVAPFIYTLF